MNQTTISLPSVAIARLVAAVAGLQGKVQFAGVTYRAKESGELARHTFILGASYENCLKTSVTQLVQDGGQALGVDMQTTRELEKVIESLAKGSAARKAANAALASFQTMIGAERAARAELCISFMDSLASGATGEENKRYTKAGIYETICPGIKVSRTDGSFELCGLSHAKTVIEPGTYPVVNSSTKTIAKNALRKTLPIGKYRTLALDVGALDSVRIGGSEIDVQDV
jgi:hypothetical protein